MWRFLIAPLSLIGTAFGQVALGEELGRPYGPFDAIAEGTQASELRRLTMIDSQLDTVDQLRSAILPVAQPRLLGGPGVAAYPYGRRGILGLRPQGYVVVPRSRTVFYRRAYILQPPEPPLPPMDGYSDGSNLADESARQPIGHQSAQTGPNRWEYRPLYADDDQGLDEQHRQIESQLRPAAEDNRAELRRPAGSAPRAAGAGNENTEFEELPAPLDSVETRTTRPPIRGQARDVARSTAFAEEGGEGETNRSPARNNHREIRQDNRPDKRVPPPPRPDPTIQPENSVAQPKPASDDAELRGPLLQNPSTGSREF